METFKVYEMELTTEPDFDMNTNGSHKMVCATITGKAEMLADSCCNITTFL